jgi:hypothetical protein
MDGVVGDADVLDWQGASLGATDERKLFFHKNWKNEKMKPF